MIIDRDNYPTLRAAMAEIEMDNGGHLLGTVYPGEKIDLDRFRVPEAWQHLVPGAERGLARLDWNDLVMFACGEQTEQEFIKDRQGDLAEAHLLLNDWFNGFQPEDAPFSSTLPSDQCGGDRG